MTMFENIFNVEHGTVIIIVTFGAWDPGFNSHLGQNFDEVFSDGEMSECNYCTVLIEPKWIKNFLSLPIDPRNKIDF